MPSLIWHQQFFGESLFSAHNPPTTESENQVEILDATATVLSRDLKIPPPRKTTKTRWRPVATTSIATTTTKPITTTTTTTTTTTSTMTTSRLPTTTRSTTSTTAAQPEPTTTTTTATTQPTTTITTTSSKITTTAQPIPTPRPAHSTPQPMGTPNPKPSTLPLRPTATEFAPFVGTGEPSLVGFPAANEDEEQSELVQSGETWVRKSQCFGPELVVGFALSVTLLSLMLLGVTVRFLAPFLKRKILEHLLEECDDTSQREGVTSAQKLGYPAAFYFSRNPVVRNPEPDPTYVECP